MITNLAGAAASCTGTWQQKWNCGWNKPVSPALARGSYDFGHLLPVLVGLLVIVLLVRAARKRKKSRSRAPATAGARR